jgi:hypothetical protein
MFVSRTDVIFSVFVVMASVEDIWNSLKDNDAKVNEEYRQRSKILGVNHYTELSSLSRNQNQPKKKPKAKVRKNGTGHASLEIPSQNSLQTEEILKESTESEPRNIPSSPPPIITPTDLRQKITRSLHFLDSTESSERTKGLKDLQKVIFNDFTLSSRDCSEVFADICRPVFKRFADNNERNRSLAFALTSSFFSVFDFSLLKKIKL